MRNPIFVRVDRFDLDGVSSDIDAIRDYFDKYLDSYPSKSSRSKYSLMGPIGKVLQEAHTGKWDAESLTGYALNIHLSNPKANGYISQEARDALRDGINQLLELLKRVPVTAQDKILDRIDYGLYFTRRAKGLEWIEKVRLDFINFLKNKYATPEKLAATWDDKSSSYADDFAKIPYPSKKLFLNSEGQKKIDIAEFVKHAELRGYELIEEDDVL